MPGLKVLVLEGTFFDPEAAYLQDYGALLSQTEMAMLTTARVRKPHQGPDILCKGDVFAGVYSHSAFLLRCGLGDTGTSGQFTRLTKRFDLRKPLDVRLQQMLTTALPGLCCL